MGYRRNHRTSFPQSSLPLVVVAGAVADAVVVVVVVVADAVVVVVVGNCACWQHKIGEVVDWQSPTAAAREIIPPNWA